MPKPSGTLLSFLLSARAGGGGPTLHSPPRARAGGLSDNLSLWFSIPSLSVWTPQKHENGGPGPERHFPELQSPDPGGRSRKNNQARDAQQTTPEPKIYLYRAFPPAASNRCHPSQRNCANTCRPPESTACADSATGHHHSSPSYPNTALEAPGGVST